MGDEELTAWVTFDEMKKGGWCMIKGNPCKVTDITAKVKGTGASANDRVVITGTHYLTGKQSTDTVNLTNAHDGLEVPITSKKKYTLLDVDADSGFLSLLTDDGDTKTRTARRRGTTLVRSRSKHCTTSVDTPILVGRQVSMPRVAVLVSLSHPRMRRLDTRSRQLTTGADVIKRFDEGEALNVTVLSIMGKDMVVGVETDHSA
jgi:translation elongation factor P/translation initiation factor 5A/urease beta subunit